MLLINGTRSLLSDTLDDYVGTFERISVISFDKLHRKLYSTV